MKIFVFPYDGASLLERILMFHVVDSKLEATQGSLRVSKSAILQYFEVFFDNLCGNQAKSAKFHGPKNASIIL